MPSAGSGSSGPRGNQPEQNSITRRMVCTLSPPSRIGGCGVCTGLGQDQLGSKHVNSPS